MASSPGRAAPARDKNEVDPEDTLTQPSSWAATTAKYLTVPIPGPLKRLFDRYPVLTYPPNELPATARGGARSCWQKEAPLPRLYVFSGEEDAAAGRPSFNPGCLKWQTYLHLNGIQHILVASNNHASPTGILPFLLPAIESSSQNNRLPIPSPKLQSYTVTHAATSTAAVDAAATANPRHAAYMALLDTPIRRAWLYTLYLSAPNFAAIVDPLYIQPLSSNPLVRAYSAYTLRQAAAAELRLSPTSAAGSTASPLDGEQIYAEAEAALDALAVLLGEADWFLAGEHDAKSRGHANGHGHGKTSRGPGLFDAAVFAYTHLVLGGGSVGGPAALVFADDRLARALSRHTNLCRHRDRVWRLCYAR